MSSNTISMVDEDPLQGATTTQTEKDYFDDESRVIYITQSMINPTTAAAVTLSHIENDHVRFYKYRFEKEMPSGHSAVQDNPTADDLTNTFLFVKNLKAHLMKVARFELKRRYILLAQSERYSLKRTCDSQLVSSFEDVRAILQEKDYATQYNFKYAIFPAKWDRHLELVVMNKAGVKYRPNSRGKGKNKDCVASICSTAAHQVRNALTDAVKRRTKQEIDENGKTKRRRDKTKFALDADRMVVVDLTQSDSPVLQSHLSSENSTADLQKQLKALEAHVEGGGTIETIQQF